MKTFVQSIIWRFKSFAVKFRKRKHIVRSNAIKFSSSGIRISPSNVACIRQFNCLFGAYKVVENMMELFKVTLRKKIRR